MPPQRLHHPISPRSAPLDASGHRWAASTLLLVGSAALLVMGSGCSGELGDQDPSARDTASRKPKPDSWRPGPRRDSAPGQQKGDSAAAQPADSTSAGAEGTGITPDTEAPADSGTPQDLGAALADSSGGQVDSPMPPRADAQPPLADARPTADSSANLCGDKVCNGDESCTSCPTDCGACTMPQSWAECIARAKTTVTTISGSQSLYTNNSPPSDWNLDLGDATFDAYPDATTTPIKIGKSTPGGRMCIGGGIVIGQQSRDSLTWYDMHDTIGGGGYRIHTAPGQWSRIDGIRVDNVEDALKPRGPDGYWELWNAYMTYIRDDCIENDEMAPGSVYDSLFDGCYTGFSEQEQSGCCEANPGEVFVVRRSLMRLQAMPGPYRNNDPSVLGHGKWFKWQAPVPHPVEIYDSIFMTELPPPSSTHWPFPSGTRTVNVTIVWLGAGEWKWPVPAGTTVTTDRGVWDRARQRWLDRHGCTSFDHCTKLRNPDPWP